MSRVTLKKLTAIALLPALLAFATGTSTAKPMPGKYKGKTGASGTDGRISFRVSGNGRKVSGLFVSAFVLCPRQNKFVTVAIRVPGGTKLKGNGKFSTEGLDADGNRYKVIGKAKGSKKFKGSAEVSTFSSFFNPITLTLDGEACAGSRDWTAKR